MSENIGSLPLENMNNRTIIKTTNQRELLKFVEENKVTFERIYREPVYGESRDTGGSKYHL